MDQIVNATYARNNFRTLLDQVAKQGRRFILVRDSIPQAVVVPYQEMLEKDEMFNQRFDQAIERSRKYFLKWLKAKGVNSATLTEKRVYELIKKA